MQKKFFKITVNALIFVAFSYFMPGIAIANGGFGRLLVGAGYGILFNSLNDIIHFFRLPNTLVSKTITGLALITGYLFILVTQFPKFLVITKGYIGGIDFILFTSNKLMILDSQVSVIMASALILFVCSIIMEKIKK